MKRSLLDITQKISRKIGHAILVPKDLTNSTYWIFEASGWRLVDILREIEYRPTQDRLRVYFNTQVIVADDYIIEQGINGLLIKFIKARFEFYTLHQTEMDEIDYIEIKGDIEEYA
jgi:hypothetical protein